MSLGVGADAGRVTMTVGWSGSNFVVARLMEGPSAAASPGAAGRACTTVLAMTLETAAARATAPPPEAPFSAAWTTVDAAAAAAEMEMSTL